MHSTLRWPLFAAAGSLTLLGCAAPEQREGGPQQMSFFVTSKNPGKGGDLGGLAGADAHCKALATAAGAGNRNWRAYLSRQGKELTDKGVVHARDRIGQGPWYNAKGVRIALDVNDLHSAGNNVTKATALDENGRIVNGRTEKPNRHDILTGSRPDGTAMAPSGRFGDKTCSNWTNGSAQGSAMLGHHDRAGPTGDAWAVSWNSAHPSIGCDLGQLAKTGGGGLFYCFAAD
jgi:hypothetical protein